PKTLKTVRPQDLFALQQVIDHCTEKMPWLRLRSEFSPRRVCECRPEQIRPCPRSYRDISAIYLHRCHSRTRYANPPAPGPVASNQYRQKILQRSYWERRSYAQRMFAL